MHLEIDLLSTESQALQDAEQVGLAFQQAYAVANSLNTEYCDPFFRKVVNTSVISSSVNMARRSLQDEQQPQQEEAVVSSSSSPPSVAPSMSLDPSTSIIPSSAPSVAPTIEPIVSFNFVILVIGECRGCTVGDLLEPVNQLSTRRRRRNLQSMSLGEEIVVDAVSDRVQLAMDLDQLLNQPTNCTGLNGTSECVCLAVAERRGPRVRTYVFVCLL